MISFMTNSLSNTLKGTVSFRPGPVFTPYVSIIFMLIIMGSAPAGGASFFSLMTAGSTGTISGTQRGVQPVEGAGRAAWTQQVWGYAHRCNVTGKTCPAREKCAALFLRLCFHGVCVRARASRPP